MPENNIMGLTFKLEPAKNNKGEEIKGVSEADFSMQTKSIFSNLNLNISSVFEELGEDGDKILTDKELRELTSYLDEIETGDFNGKEDITDEIQNIINSSNDLSKKLDQIKDLNLNKDDIKGLTVSKTQELLNLIAGAYANEPDKMTNDSLYNAIEKNVPSNVFKDAVTSQNSGYWLKKYGIEQMTKSFNSKNTHRIDTKKPAQTAYKDNTYEYSFNTQADEEQNSANLMFSKEDDFMPKKQNFFSIENADNFFNFDMNFSNDE